MPRLAAGDRKTVLLAGDGGLQLSFGEFVTLVQENANVLLIVMNDRGYGVIRNIQDDKFGGRKVLADLHTPDFQAFAKSIGLASAKAGDMPSFHAALEALGNRNRPGVARSRHDRVRPVRVGVRRAARTRERAGMTTAAAALQPIFIGGAWRAGRGEPVVSINPVDGSVNATFAGADAADVAEAVERGVAAMADPAWRNLLPHERARILRRIGDGLAAETEVARALAIARQRQTDL